MKCQPVNSSQKSISATSGWDSILSAITQDPWPYVGIGIKTDLKIESFAVFESSCFVTTDR